MVTNKQKIASRLNIRKALKKWMRMSHRERAIAQPQGRARAKPGTKGEGNYFRIEVRPKTEFTSFRTHDVGNKGHLQRIAGKRKSGSWATQCWLVSKKDAVVQGNTLVGKTKDVKNFLSKLSTKPMKFKADVFKAKDRKNVSEKSKPTLAMKIAQKKNIKKAQAARWR